MGNFVSEGKYTITIPIYVTKQQKTINNYVVCGMCKQHTSVADNYTLHGKEKLREGSRLNITHSFEYKSINRLTKGSTIRVAKS